MDEILKTLAGKTGLDVSTATNGLGAIIAFLKAHLPPDLFGRVTDAVPDSASLADTYEANKSAPGIAGGLIAAASGVVGKFLGGGGEGAAQLVKMLESSGLHMSQIPGFLSHAVQTLESQLPADLIEKVKGLLLHGTPATPSEG